MRKITIVLLFVIGFTALSCSKSSNHDDVTENTTKTPDETAINTEKIVGKWEFTKIINLDANHNQISEVPKDKSSCPLGVNEFIKGGSFVFVSYYKNVDVCSSSERKGTWNIKANEITITVKGEKGDGDDTYTVKIATLNDSVFETEYALSKSDPDYGTNVIFRKNHFTRKN